MDNDSERDRPTPRIGSPPWLQVADEDWGSADFGSRPSKNAYQLQMRKPVDDLPVFPRPGQRRDWKLPDSVVVVGSVGALILGGVLFSIIVGSSSKWVFFVGSLLGAAAALLVWALCVWIWWNIAALVGRIKWGPLMIAAVAAMQRVKRMFFTRSNRPR
ncbi:MAG: hypothetical protein ABI759_10965 [Candidatus Solibacter sp.]